VAVRCAHLYVCVRVYFAEWSCIRPAVWHSCSGYNFLRQQATVSSDSAADTVRLSCGLRFDKRAPALVGLGVAPGRLCAVSGRGRPPVYTCKMAAPPSRRKAWPCLLSLSAAPCSPVLQARFARFELPPKPVYAASLPCHPNRCVPSPADAVFRARWVWCVMGHDNRGIGRKHT